MKREKTFFCHLSGELPSRELPAHEIIAILKASNINFKILQIYDQVLLYTSSEITCELIAQRAAFVHRCCELVSNISETNFDIIKKELKQIDFSELLKDKATFAVRIKKIKTYFPSISEETIEREIGTIIKTSSKERFNVDLNNPNILFFGIFTETNFVFGISLYELTRNLLRKRAPHTRPFFHPCGLDPYLARAMVNISEINKPQILYDPFCGSGSILIEAALMGFKIIGSDISYKMLRGTSLNLKALNIEDFNIFRADARKFCIKSISYLVTDPPYGRSSSTYGQNLVNLLADFFNNNFNMIEENSLSIIAIPSTFKIDNIISKYNFKIQNEFDYYVHRSLTRKIIVIKKM
jgi:tRNA (guanine10-N2)-dimethyltransferase